MTAAAPASAAPPPRYDRRQIAWWLRLAFLGVDAAVFIALVATGVDGYVFVLAGVAAAVFLAIGWGFSSLHVVVDATDLRIAFGVGWPRKTIPRAEITSATPVRNRWWWGFGIRYTPAGWMWNVSGLDAVAIERGPGRTFRIGTDDPEGLAAAIHAARPAVAADRR